MDLSASVLRACVKYRGWYQILLKTFFLRVMAFTIKKKVKKAHLLECGCCFFIGTWTREEIY